MGRTSVYDESGRLEEKSEGLVHTSPHLPDDEVVKRDLDGQGNAPEGCSLSPSYPSNGEAAADPELRVDEPRYRL